MTLPQAGGRVHVERLQRDGAAALGPEEARALVERDAPELLALLEELKDSLTELRSRVGPVLAQVCLLLCCAVPSVLCCQLAELNLCRLCRQTQWHRHQRRHWHWRRHWRVRVHSRCRLCACLGRPR